MRRKQDCRPYAGRRRPVWRWAAALLLLAAWVAFGVLEAVVLSGGRTQIQGQPEIMVIFGCQVKPDGPSALLRDRLDTALDYLAGHPDLTVVVTGGQGDDEHVSEAQCMYDYLTGHGVDGERIVLEDRSSNTWQNIRYTLELYQSGALEPSGKFLLVSSDFHLRRIKLLWERAWPGTYTLSTLAAPCSHLPSRVQMFFREPLALAKSFFFDR